MNFLAHAYLSFGDPGLLTGNMISDFVKGKKQFDYPEAIQKGIRLHRAIDEFTDTHPATREVKELFRPVYRLYAGALTDVVYDYCLANDVNEFPSETALAAFTEKTYSQLRQQSEFFPPSFATAFTHMQAHDWLYNYRLNDGIRKSLAGVGRRAVYIKETDTAYETFLSGKKLIVNCYKAFFPDLKAFTAHKAKEFSGK